MLKKMAMTPSNLNSNENANYKKVQAYIQETPIDNDKTYTTLAHHKQIHTENVNIFNKLKYNITHTTNNTLPRHLTTRITHYTKKEKIHINRCI